MDQFKHFETSTKYRAKILYTVTAKRQLIEIIVSSQHIYKRLNIQQDVARYVVLRIPSLVHL